MKYLPDTSCLIALLCSWHEHHGATLKEMTRRKRSGETAVLAAHSLMETYAVLTRLPYPYRLSERDAWTLLDLNFSKTQMITLTSAQYWRVIRVCRDQNISGGEAYDSVIAACARKAGATVLLTWNREHFARFQDKNLVVETPA
jgi:predicted nucleic acid-binding protein